MGTYWQNQLICQLIVATYSFTFFSLAQYFLKVIEIQIHMNGTIDTYSIKNIAISVFLTTSAL